MNNILTMRRMLTHPEHYVAYEGYLLLVKEQQFRIAQHIVFSQDIDILNDLHDAFHPLFCPEMLISMEDWKLDNATSGVSFNDIVRDGYIIFKYLEGSFQMCDFMGERLLSIPLNPNEQDEEDIDGIGSAIHSLIESYGEEEDEDPKDLITDLSPKMDEAIQLLRADLMLHERYNYYSLIILKTISEDDVIQIRMCYALVNMEYNDYSILNCWRFLMCMDHPIDICSIVLKN